MLQLYSLHSGIIYPDQMHFTCPVCNTDELSTTSRGNTICPECHSDLSDYLLVYSIEKKKLQIDYFYASLIVLALLAFAWWYYLKARNHTMLSKNSIEQKINVLPSNNAIQNTSQTITILDSPVIASAIPGPHPQLQQASLPLSSDCQIQYKVKSGDCITRIARLYYNDYYKYKKIEEDNKLVRPYKLHPGQLLIINLGK